MHHCYGIDDLDDTEHISPDYIKRPLMPYFNIHPNTNGHDKIYDKIYAQLASLKNSITSVNNRMLYH